MLDKELLLFPLLEARTGPWSFHFSTLLSQCRYPSPRQLDCLVRSELFWKSEFLWTEPFAHDWLDGRQGL